MGSEMCIRDRIWGAIQLRNIQDGSVDPDGKRMLVAGTLVGLFPCIAVGLFLTYLLFELLVG